MNPLIHYIETTESTSTYLQNKLQEGRPLPSNGYAIACFRQSAGRGQRGNHWESEANKNIAISLILHTADLPVRLFFSISQIVSLAICRFLDNYLNDISIKWPNDIYYKDKKIAGILIENQLQGNFIQYSVIGIGLNVNQTVFRSDAPNPVSMKQILHQDFDLKELTESLYDSIIQSYPKVLSPNISPVASIPKTGFPCNQANDPSVRYKNRLFRAKGYYPYRDKDGTFMAEIVDIETNGTLLLKEQQSGDIRKYAFKEVQYLL